MEKLIELDQLADEIVKELKAYNQDVVDELKENAKSVANECLKEIKANSPVNSNKNDKRYSKSKTKNYAGRYKRGWRLKVAFESDSDIRIVIHNKTDYQLTHLLEYGHVIRNAKGGPNLGRVPAIPHVRPAEQRAEQKLIDKVKVAIIKK